MNCLFGRSSTTAAPAIMGTRATALVNSCTGTNSRRVDLGASGWGTGAGTGTAAATGAAGRAPNGAGGGGGGTMPPRAGGGGGGNAEEDEEESSSDQSGKNNMEPNVTRDEKCGF